MNCVLIQQVYPGEGYEPLLELTRERNAEYCKRWNMDFQCLVDAGRFADIKFGGWTKIDLMKQALDKGYKYVIWLDADALIKDLDTDLRDGCPKGIGVCWMRIPQLHHWNVGVMYLTNSKETRDFVDEWLSKYPGERQWMEQGEFNKLAMQSRVVETISDRWNATLNYSMVPDAVVLGYHGNGDAKQRYEMMRGTLARISPQKAEQGAGGERGVTGKE